MLGRGQNALFKIAMKLYLEHLMILDFDAYLWGGRGGLQCFIEDSREAIFKTLDFDN